MRLANALCRFVELAEAADAQPAAGPERATGVDLPDGPVPAVLFPELA